MPNKPNPSRDERVFNRVLDGTPYRDIAQELGVTETRVDQIFKQQARQRLPAVFEQVPAGRGYAARFIQAAKAQRA